MKYFLPHTCSKCPTAQLVHNHDYCSRFFSAQLLIDSNIYFSQGYQANRRTITEKNSQISRTLHFILLSTQASRFVSRERLNTRT